MISCVALVHDFWLWYACCFIILIQYLSPGCVVLQGYAFAVSVTADGSFVICRPVVVVCKLLVLGLKERVPWQKVHVHVHVHAHCMVVHAAKSRTSQSSV